MTLNLNGFDVRFSYDITKLQPSNIETNATTTDEKQYFQFAQEFSDKLNFMTIPFDETGNGIRAIITMNTPITQSSEHIKQDGEIGGYVIDTTEDVKLGTMSFQMKQNEEFKVDYFSLVESTQEKSPLTGIKISIDGAKSYQDKKTFRFTDQTTSKDADLSDLKVSKGELEGEDITYDLTPSFDSNETNYNVKILDNIDTVNITAIPKDEKSTMKIRLPKRNEEGNLVFNDGGNTVDNIQYEEFDDISSGQPRGVTLNKLGEPDTRVTIIVTAEDKHTTKEYTILIHRPYGTIKGKIQLGENVRNSTVASYGITTKYIADVKLYKSSEIKWEDIVPGNLTLDEIDANETIKAQTKSDEEGNYEVYVLPGKYDMLIEKLGYLADITKDITIDEGDIINMNPDDTPTILTEGDVDRTGIIELTDMVLIVNLSGSNKGDLKYQESGDFGQKGFIALDDLIFVNNNMYKEITIRSYV